MTVDLGGHRQVQGINYSKCDQHGHIIIKSSDTNNSFTQLQARRVWRDYCMDVQVGNRYNNVYGVLYNYPCLWNYFTIIHVYEIIERAWSSWWMQVTGPDWTRHEGSWQVGLKDRDGFTRKRNQGQRQRDKKINMLRCISKECKVYTSNSRYSQWGARTTSGSAWE